MNNDIRRPEDTKQHDLVERAEAIEASPQPLATEPVFVKTKRSKAMPFLIFLLLLALAGAGYMYYLWQHERNEAEKARNEITRRIQEDMNNPVATDGGSDFAPQTAIGGEAMQYVEAYRTTEVPYRTKIQYMNDTFARVDVATIDPNDKTKETGTEATLFLKKVQPKNTIEKPAADNNEQNWVLIWTQPLTDANKKYLKDKFGVTDEVFTMVRPE